MKQYESVFFRHREMNSSEYLEVDGCGLTESSGPVIVLTIEELREICRAVVSEWVEIKPAGSMDADIDKDLHNHLTSKGITI